MVFAEDGIFVIEAKNLNAQIEGSWNNQQLDAYYSNNDKHAIYNPIKQNENHCLHLKNILGEHSEYFHNIVVFGTYTRFEYIDVPWNAQICRVQGLIKSMERLSKHTPRVIEKHMMGKWIENLEKTSNKLKEQHN